MSTIPSFSILGLGLSAAASTRAESFVLPAEPSAVTASQQRRDGSYDLARLCGRTDAVDRAFAGRVAFIGGGHRPEPSREDFDNVISQGQGLQSSGRYEDAIQKYRQAFAMNHDWAMSRFLCASAMMRDLRCPENALPALKELNYAHNELLLSAPMEERERALSALIRHDKSQIFGILGRTQESVGEYAAALNELRALSSSNPEQEAALEETAALALRAGAWVVHLFEGAGHSAIAREAVSTELTMCRMNKNFRGEAKLHFELGLTAHYRGNFQEARSYYEKSLEALEKSGDERLARNSAVEQTNWAPFLRLMIDLCDAALSPVPTAVDFASEARQKDLKLLESARPKSLGLKHAFELVFGLAWTIFNIPGCTYPAEDTFDLASEMASFLDVPSKLSEIELGMALLADRDGRKEDALFHAHHALGFSLETAWEDLSTDQKKSNLHIKQILGYVVTHLSSDPLNLEEAHTSCVIAASLFAQSIPGFVGSIHDQRIHNALQLIQNQNSRRDR